MIQSTLRPRAPGCNRFRQEATRAAAVCAIVALAWPLAADIQPGGSGRGDDKANEARRDAIRRAAEIPTPQDATVTVLRGVPARIVLSASTLRRQPVIFRLGTRPAHGTLSEPRAVPEAGDKAVVTYTAGAGSADADSFTFRVKHDDTATSGSATVRLRILDPAPDLQAPEELDFGQVVVGETVVRSLVLANQGTADFAAALPLQPPWRLQQGSPEVRVAAGARVEINVLFAPWQPGEATARLAYPGVEKTRTLLKGRALAPVHLEPSLVQMKWDPSARLRRASVTLENRLNAPVDYVLAASPRVQFSAERGTLPALGSADVAVELPLPDTADLQSLLSVTSNGVREEVPVTAAPAPALLALRESLGLKRSGTTSYTIDPQATEGALVVANEGGEEASLAVTLPDGWTSPDLVNAAILEPGEARSLLLVPPVRRGVPITGTLKLRLARERVEVVLHAPVLPSSAPVASHADERDADGRDSDALLDSAASAGAAASGPRDLTHDEAQLQFMIDTLGIFPHDTRFDRSLPEFKEVIVGKMEPDRVPISLRSAGSDYTYVIFRDTYRPPPGGKRPTRHWLPVEGLVWKSSGESVSTTLGGLAPGARVVLRFAVRTADGRIGPPSDPIVITTPVPKPLRWPWWLAGGALAGAFWWWRRRRRREA